MKRFLRNCLALLLPLAFLFFIGGQAYRQSNGYINWEREEGTEKYRDIPEAITFAVFGPSHGMEAFHARDYGSAFFNFALNSQTPQYDLMQMREFQDRIQPGATVVLTVSYISPFWTDEPEGFEEKQGRYYRILSPGNIVECDLGRWVMGRWSPLLETDCSQFITDWLFPNPLVPGRFDLLNQGRFQPKEVEEEQQRIRKNHLALIQPGLPDGAPVMLEALREMLSICREKGWKAVLVTPPYLAEYTACFSQEVLEQFRAITAQLAEENDVPWLNYAQDADFAGTYDYFRDIDHLNNEGASVFSRKICTDLAALGYPVA